MKKISKKHIAEIILSVFLFMQILLIIYTNFFLMEANIDCDSAKLFVHAVEMWRNKTPIIPDWLTITTLELDCSTLLAVPLFGVTRDIFLSYAIANIILLLVLIATIFYLFQKENNRIYALISAILICIPYRIGMLDYFNMLYFNGAQYIIKVTIPLMLLALITHSESFLNCKKDKVEFIIFNIIFSIFLFTSCLSSGLYIILCGILPVILGSFLWRVFKNNKISIGYIIVITETMLAAGIGYGLNHFLNIGSKGNSMQLCNIYDGLTDNISSCFLGIFEVFGGVAYTETAAMSTEGINILLRLIFVWMFLICALVTAVKFLKKQAQELSVLLLLIFVWNFFILCVCDIRYGAGTFEYRYHLIGLIPLICLSTKELVDWIKNYRRTLQIGIVVCATMFVGILMVTSYKAIFEKEDRNEAHREICAYAEEMGVDYVYFLYESEAPEICRAIDYENALYLQLMDGGITWVYDYYAQYEHVPMIQENFIIVCDNGIYDFGDQMEMFGYIFARSRIIGTKSIYEVTGFAE